MISVWPKFYSFDPEMVLHFHFTFKPFPGHAQKRERETARKRDRTSTQHRRRPDRSTSKSSDEPRKPKTEIVRQAMPQSSDREPIPQIVELIRWTHSSDRRARSLNPFLRSSSSSVEPIPQITNPNRPPEIVPPNHRSTCSGSILLWVDLVADPLALWFLGWSLIGWIFFCWVLRIWVLMNLDFVGVDDIFVWKLRKCKKMRETW